MREKVKIFCLQLTGGREIFCNLEMPCYILEQYKLLKDSCQCMRNYFLQKSIFADLNNWMNSANDHISTIKEPISIIFFYNFKFFECNKVFPAFLLYLEQNKLQ